MADKDENEVKRLNDVGFVLEKVELFDDFDKATSGLAPFLSTKELVDPSKLTIEFNGACTFVIQGTKYHTTRFGLTSLCKLFKIPDPFSRLIPVDLLKANIDRLAKEYKKEIQMVLDQHQNIIGFTAAKYRPIQHIDLLPRLKDKFAGCENLIVALSTRNVLVQFTSPSFPTFTIREGEFIKVGLEIVNSEVNDWDAKAQIFMLRTKDNAGALMTENWGKISRNKNNKLQYETVVEQFVTGCVEFKTDMTKLSEIFTKLPNISLNSRHFAIVYGALLHVAGKSVAEQVLSTDEAEAKDFTQFEKRRNKWNFRYAEWYGKPPKDTQKNAYTVFDRLLDAANGSTDLIYCRKMRAIAGKLIASLMIEE